MHEPLMLLFATKSREAPKKRAKNPHLQRSKQKMLRLPPEKHAMVTIYKSEIRQKYRHVQA